jgi:hypothetical protein
MDDKSFREWITTDISETDFHINHNVNGCQIELGNQEASQEAQGRLKNAGNRIGISP